MSNTMCRSNSPVILVTGKDGQAGRALSFALAPLGKVITVGRREVDLSDISSIRILLKRIRPTIIVNAAAYTQVDLAEQEQKIAFAINYTAPAIMAEYAAKHQVLLIHYSTDFVFNGYSTQPYTEQDDTDPINLYGQSKLAGEKAVQQNCFRHLIFRTSWLYSQNGQNFISVILNQVPNRKTIKVIDDQIGTPTSTVLLANVTTKIISQFYHYDSSLSFPFGIYHLSAVGQISRYKYAKKILDYAKRSGYSFLGNYPNIIPVSSENYPTLALRPRYSVLDNKLIQHTFDIDLPKWENDVRITVTQIVGNQPMHI